MWASMARRWAARVDGRGPVADLRLDGYWRLEVGERELFGVEVMPRRVAVRPAHRLSGVHRRRRSRPGGASAMPRWQQHQQPVGGAQQAPGRGADWQTNELMRFKAMLDSGLITQQDFDAKKHQILFGGPIVQAEPVGVALSDAI